MKNVNLRGLRILNTRPKEQQKLLNEAIIAANGQPVCCPGLKIIEPSQPWVHLIPDLTAVEHALFTSTNAVIYSFRHFQNQKIAWPPTIRVTAIGKSTANALRAEKIKVHNIPPIADSEHLLFLDDFQHIQNKTILLFKGEGGRELISATLNARGAKLTELNVYQRIMPRINRKQLEAWWRENAVDIILFTSQEAMQNIFSLFGAKAHDWLTKTPCLVISERLAAAAQLLGMQTIIICSIDTIINALHQFNKGLTHG